MNRLNKTESAVFLYCRFSLFSNDSWFPDYVLTAGILPENMIKTEIHSEIFSKGLDIHNHCYSEHDLETPY